MYFVLHSCPFSSQVHFNIYFVCISTTGIMYWCWPLILEGGPPLLWPCFSCAVWIINWWGRYYSRLDEDITSMLLLLLLLLLLCAILPDGCISVWNPGPLLERLWLGQSVYSMHAAETRDKAPQLNPPRFPSDLNFQQRQNFPTLRGGEWIKPESQCQDLKKHVKAMSEFWNTQCNQLSWDFFCFLSVQISM